MAEVQNQTLSQVKKEIRKEIINYLQVLEIEYKETQNTIKVRGSIEYISMSNDLESVTIRVKCSKSRIQIYQKRNYIQLKLGGKDIILPYNSLIQYNEKELTIYI